jgi:DNA (cytosine-5)-methyltransferase 1
VNRTTVRAGGPAWPLNTSAQAHVVTTAFNGYTGGADDNDAQGGHLVATPLRAEGHDASEDGTGRQNLVTVAFTERTRPDGVSLEMQEEPAYALTNPGAGSRTTSRNIAGAFGVRRLTPVECERLQGFPDNWTAYGADGPQSDSARYRQLGNAVAVPVAEWLGRRIIAAEMETNQ